MSPSKTIQLEEVLNYMDSFASFSMAWVTSDDSRNEGGEWVEVTEARKHDYLPKKERQKLEKAQPEDTRVKRNPHHYENSTRNIILPNGEIRKIAIRLIRRFDVPGVENLFLHGKTVM